MFAGILKAFAPTHFASRYDLAHDGRLHMLEARRGRGKSYILSEWASRAFMAGVPVRANFDLDLYWFALDLVKAGKQPSLIAAMDWLKANFLRIRSWDDVILSYDTVVLLDEVNRLWDSRSGAGKAPQVTHEFLQQSRKMRNTLVFAAQGFDWLDVRLRQLFDMLWRVRRLDDRRLKVRTPKTFFAYGGDPWGSGLSHDVVRNAEAKFTVEFHVSRTRRYNTLEIIQALTDEPQFATMHEVVQALILADIVKFREPVYAVDSIPLVVLLKKLVPADGYGLRGSFSKSLSIPKNVHALPSLAFRPPPLMPARDLALDRV